MPYITVGKENSGPLELYYEDHGSGQPVVLIHGYPLDGHSGERQERALLDAGYRTIAYDRRGFGQSSKPTTGYDYDTFTADLKALLDHLSLDQDVVLCGFSMGTGEVTHYLGTDGSAGVSKAVLFGAIPPFLLKTDDNPDELAPERIGDAALRASFQVAAGASWYASYACVDTWLTDFRADVEKIDIPTLVVHGTKDRILPFESTAGRLEALNPNFRVVPVENGPHNIGWTFPEESNRALLGFL